MRPTTLWARVLGVEGFVVEHVAHDDEKRAITVAVRTKQASSNRCPKCRKRCPRYDRGRRRRWRALDAGIAIIHLEADAPRIRCSEHGVVVASVPWARHCSRMTTTLEDWVAWMAAHTDKSTVASLARIAWRTVGAIVGRVCAERAKLVDRFKGVRRIGVDEIAYRKGHKFLTVIVDHDTGRLIWAHEGKGQEALRSFFAALGPERCAQVVLVSTDAAPWYLQLLETTFTNAHVCIDPFHVVAWAGLALDSTRRELWTELKRAGHGAMAQALKGSRWALWKNPEELTTKQRASLERLEKLNHPIYRGYLLKEQLREVFKLRGQRGVMLLQRWVDMALDSELPHFVDVGKRVAKNMIGIVAALEHGLSNARVEAINTQIRLITRFAFGFHSAAPLIALAMLRLGGLCPNLPGRN
jgi:transposase